jgi:hypothetical protein
MTDALLFTDDGVVSLVEVDPNREDVILELVAADRTQVLALRSLNLRLVFAVDARADRRMNLPISLLAYGAGQPAFYAIRGSVLVFGGGVDDALVDVPPDLLTLFDVDLAT